ncbi:unnamed protein product, partial [Hermetia illucens]
GGASYLSPKDLRTMIIRSMESMFTISSEAYFPALCKNQTTQQ